MKRFIICLVALSLLGFYSCQNDSISDDPLIPKEKGKYELTNEEIAGMLGGYLQTIQVNNPNTRSANGAVITNLNKVRYDNPIVTRSGITEDNGFTICNVDLKVGEKDGFAIVVADKRFPVVLAYSPNGKYSDLEEKGSENLQTYVENIPNDVKAVLTDPRYLTTDLTNDTSKIFKAFPYYNDRDEIYATEDFSGIWHDVALLRESVLWGQFSPYNDSLPINPKKGKPFPVGCVNVALSQIMAYYKHPAKYDWDVMAACVNIANIPFFPAEITAIITTFIKELTTITKTKFKEEFNTSAVNIPDMVAALDTLGYAYDPLILYNSNAVRTSLKARKFVIATGRAQTDEVHAFVLSGYWKFTIPEEITNLQNGTNLGVNWGNAGGWGDGWYLVEYGSKKITDLGLAKRDPTTGKVTGPNYTETLYILPGICPK